MNDRMKRAPLICAVAGAGLLLALLLLVLRNRTSVDSGPRSSGRHESPASKSGVDTRPGPDGIRHEANVVPRDNAGRERNEAGLREKFERHILRLVRLVDRDGAALLLYSDGDEDFQFIEAHAAEFRSEILRICRERGGNFDPLVARLRSLLPKGDQTELLAEGSRRLQELLGATRGQEVQRAHVLSEVVRDARLPVGLRIDALMLLRTEPTQDPGVLGQALTLLDIVKEPILRTTLYFVFLGSGDERHPITSAVLEKVVEALSSSGEARGTTVEILSAIEPLFGDSSSDAQRERLLPRIESALQSRFLQESASNPPDEAILSRIGTTMMSRRTIPTADQIQQVQELVRADCPAAVRGNAVLLLLPDLEGRTREPAVQDYLTRSRPILLEVLRREQDEHVAANVLYGLTRYRDPETNRLLLLLAEERPQLRGRIERYVKEHPLREDS